MGSAGEHPVVIDVVCALIEDPVRGLLACKRPAKAHLAGYWEFPGGKVEVEEVAQDALVREISEELGVLIEVGAAMNPVEWSDGRVSIRLHPYRCRIASGELQVHEHEEIRWCGLADVDGLLWAPADLPILAEWKSLVSPE